MVSKLQKIFVLTHLYSKKYKIEGDFNLFTPKNTLKAAAQRGYSFMLRLSIGIIYLIYKPAP